MHGDDKYPDPTDFRFIDEWAEAVDTYVMSNGLRRARANRDAIR
jgi:hypothetical protein